MESARAVAAQAKAAGFRRATAEGLYALFDRLGYGGKDFSAILELLRGHKS